MLGAIKKYIGRKIVELANHANAVRQENIHHNEGVYRFFEGAAPAVIAFEISNGFVVRTGGQFGHTGELTFCADAPALAEHIVTSGVKCKLHIQTEMFEKQQAVKTSYHGALAQTRSTHI